MSQVREVTVDLSGEDVILRYDFNAMSLLEDMAENGEITAAPKAPESTDDDDEEHPLARVKAKNIRAFVYAMAAAADMARGNPVQRSITEIGSIMPMGPETLALIVIVNGLMSAAMPEKKEEDGDEGNPPVAVVNG